MNALPKIDSSAAIAWAWIERGRLGDAGGGAGGAISPDSSGSSGLRHRARVPAVIAAYGGRYLVRGGAVGRLEGDAPAGRLVIVEFPDMMQLNAFYGSVEYQALLALRQRAAKTNLLAVEGVSAPRGTG